MDKEGNSGYGGIIRGSGRERLGGFSKNIGVYSMYIAKLWGVYKSLVLVTNMKFNNIIIEIDSQQVVKDISYPSASIKLGKNLLTKIRAFFLKEKGDPKRSGI